MQKGRDGLALPRAEMSVLNDLEEVLRATGSLTQGETIPVQSKDHRDQRSPDIGALIENNAVVALSLRYAALTALPRSIDQLASLRELDLTGNQLTALPEALAQLINLEVLHVYDNHLAALPDTLSRLTNLKDISVGHNWLTALPDSFWQLVHLQVLSR